LYKSEDPIQDMFALLGTLDWKQVNRPYTHDVYTSSCFMNGHRVWVEVSHHQPVLAQVHLVFMREPKVLHPERWDVVFLSDPSDDNVKRANSVIQRLSSENLSPGYCEIMRRLYLVAAETAAMDFATRFTSIDR
jgi:hypothetical protein